MSEGQKKVECVDCKMRFETGGELANHQKKFCKQYSNMSKLDDRLKKLSDIKPAADPAKVNNESKIEHKKKIADAISLQNKQDVEKLVREAKMFEGKKINNQAEVLSIERALKEIQKEKAGYLKQDKLKELDELDKKKREIEESKLQVQRDLQNMSHDVRHAGNNTPIKQVQNKVNNSDYLRNQDRRHTNALKNLAEENSRIKLKQEILGQKMDHYQQKAGILAYQNSAPRGRSNEPSKDSKLANSAAKILNSSSEYYAGAKINQSQERISKLIEDRKKTMNQLKYDPVFDEIDQLQASVDQGYNTDINKYRENMKNYSTDLQSQREMKPEEKAQRLSNIRSKISNFDPNASAPFINYQAAKPVLFRQMNKLDKIIKNEKRREEDEERKRVNDNMHQKLPNFQARNPNYSVIEMKNRTELKEPKMKQPVIMNYRQQSSRMSRRSQQQDSERKSRQNLIPDSRTFLPDVGHFKQNLDRPEDLEVEERAIMNMYAQDFDDLKVLDMLKDNPTLYSHKLNQYKELSHARIQAEKFLQDQRLKKIREHFGKERYEEERKMELENWMDQQEKQLISRRLQERLNMPKTPEYIPSTSGKSRVSTRPQRIEEEYDPEIGFGLHLDYVANIDRGTCNQMKAAYAIFKNDEMIIGNQSMGPALMLPDTYSITHEKAQFSTQNSLKLVEADRSTNLIMEIQIPDIRDPNRFKAIGWTLVNLFTAKLGKLNKGCFKLPMYQLPTNPYLQISEIPYLTPISGYVCMRISMIGDEISQKNSNLHPSEYLVPMIHQRGGTKRNDIPPQMQNQPQNIQIEPDKQGKDPFYSSNGLLLFLQFLKNFPTNKAGNFTVRSSLLFNENAAKDKFGQDCYWVSDSVQFTANLEQTPQNMFKIQEVTKVENLDRNDTVLPIMKTNIWHRNFYDLVWNSNLEHDLYLFLEILENGSSYPTGVTVLKVNNEDGTARVGSHELPVYKYPLKDYKDVSKSEPLGYSLALTINEPKPDVAQPHPQSPEMKIPDAQPPSVQPPKEEQKVPTPQEEEKKGEIAPSDLGKKDSSEEAFIPNTLKQYDESPYDRDEIIVVYVDSARYLPENCTIARLVMRGINRDAENIMKTFSSVCLSEMSTSQKPYFGIREEFIRKDTPSLDDTTVLVFRIDSIERNNHKQVVVGYAFFPLFVDPSTGLPANHPTSDAALQTGKYQIPIFCQTPRLARPFSYQNVTALERIPCASLLIRIEKAPTDDKGKSISIAGLSEARRVELGMLKLPPKYQQGEYNNRYIDLMKDELKIYEEKVIRVDPLVTEAIKPLRNTYENDKKFKKKIKKILKKKNVSALTHDEFSEHVFEPPEKYTTEIIDINYFSQYIHSIGFRFNIDLVFNADPRMIYVAICCINPPGSLYQQPIGYDKVIEFNEIDFNSHVKGQKFHESFYAFVNVPSNENVHMIVDIKAIKIHKKKEAEIIDYAWTIYPIFSKLDTDENKDTDEVFIRSGYHMMPLFQGKVRNDVVKDLVSVKDCWEHLESQQRLKVAPISLLPKAGVILRCVDNQREGHFSTLGDPNRIDYSFCPNPKNYQYNDKVRRKIEKGNKIADILPKNTDINMAQQEVDSLLRTKYNLLQ
ncbi:unnamed protein product [Moneuplotes crassus]|uniref:Uncharacterized protein n=3 Tax=Euplotes crassus TaxID=5936 RepID=A0AAD1TZX2_EUPCR|nr:unnamed protein product [Moneuplotes crassus]